ncbi:hypothetical protein, partial [Weissella minor]|uniref:hypothetical protein n=1 Tax=Weissella minor TaxID=1620 RepID=UPI001F210196
NLCLLFLGVGVGYKYKHVCFFFVTIEHWVTLCLALCPSKNKTTLNGPKLNLKSNMLYTKKR